MNDDWMGEEKGGGAEYADREKLQSPPSLLPLLGNTSTLSILK